MRIEAKSAAPGFAALRTVGLVAGVPIMASAVILLPPVVDTTGPLAGNRNGRPARVKTVVATRKRLVEQISDRASTDGALGLVDVRFSESEIQGLPTQNLGIATEIRATALPVVATNNVGAGAFFLTALGPADVATLLMSGWVPVDVLIAGTVLTRAPKHRQEDARVATGRANSELPGGTDLIQRARRQIRDDLHHNAHALGADGVLFPGNFEIAWSSTMHLVEVSAVASAIARWGESSLQTPQATVLSVSDVDAVQHS